MKTILTLAFPFCAGIFLTSTLQAQVYSITIQNGYTQAVQASPGDTVHVWAQEWGVARTFDYWTGDTSFLERPLEWHTRLIMPAHNVTLTAVTKLLPTGNDNPLTLELIMGRDTIKRVFSYFPANHPPAGVCWLWHGTNGSADSWAGTEFEQHEFVKYLVGKGWGVIVTESEESTKHRDINNDGYIRYDYTPDSLNNVDIQNIMAIRDTFIHRGKMSWSTPQAAVGFSAGGAFATLLAPVMNWQAGISHCAPGPSVLFPLIHTPIQFSMNRRDQDPNVGPAGIQEALDNYQYLDSVGVCTDFFMLLPSPSYGNRFKRLPGISGAQSLAINTELLSNNGMGPDGYLIKSPDQIESEVIANPSNWPVIVGLTGAQRQFVLDQIQVLWSAHHFHTDYMAADFNFISNPCGALLGTRSPDYQWGLTVYPNPGSGQFNVSETIHSARVFDLNGRLMLEPVIRNESTQFDISMLPTGLYFVQTDKGWGKVIRK